MVAQVSDAVSAGLKRVAPAVGDGVTPDKRIKGGMFAGLDGSDDSDGSDE